MNIFLLAHQDDEFGVFFEIKKLISLRERVVVIYLTSGSLDGSSSKERNKESSTVLMLIGVSKQDIFFVGGDYGYADGNLCSYMEPAFQSILKILENGEKVDRVYMLAWEGGHQDHDAVHLIGLATAKKYGVLDASWQFPLYTGYGCPWFLFCLFVANNSNGLPIKSRIPLKDRIIFLGYIFYYRSQIKTWIFLFPFLLAHYIFKGYEVKQPVDLFRIHSSPYMGLLFYERRRCFTQTLFVEKTKNFIDKFIL